jgi:flagellar basal body rod protein FlgG
MVQAAYSSISGVVAAFNLQSVSAHNVANGNTDNFKSTVARAEEA